MTPVALTIAGSDPSGGAGMQADLKTFHQHGVYGMSVVTLLTVQNTRSVSAVRHIDPEFIVAQLDAVLSDIPPQAAKTGALGSAAIINALAERAAEFEFPLVVDPVMISKHGAALLDEDAVESLKSRLLPHAFCVTPNLPEAAALTGIDVTDRAAMEQAARAIAELGPKHVLIKGGHAAGPALDLLWSAGQFHEFAAHSIKQSPWAKAYYNMMRARGNKHQAAVRALAFKWIRIIFRCWKDRYAFVVLSGTVEKPRVLASGSQAQPKGASRPQAMSWFGREVHELLVKHQPDSGYYR
ncbi:MAG: bifunctional hydroxymethylpyrimidine kinase/phosphomethylpyrimidine kinase, partial [Planctomycetes bacterium]|nr:bifunctional hydroxymethylpyrimidine kinase/phosphomethylpyrimidine kinase [Planctomycetota bacterium]